MYTKDLFCYPEGAMKLENHQSVNKSQTNFNLRWFIIIRLIILKKRTCLGTLLILNHFRSFYLFLQWSWVIWFHLFSPFKFFLIQFYFVIFKKERKCSRTLSFFNYFRCKCLFVPWSWVIIFCLFDNTFFFSIQYNKFHFNLIKFNSILFIHI